jgi:hypothetical protein
MTTPTFTQEQAQEAIKILRRVVFWSIEPISCGMQFMCSRCHETGRTREDINHNVSCHVGDAVALLVALDKDGE